MSPLPAGGVQQPVPLPLARYGVLSMCYFAAIGLFNPYAPLWFQSLGYSTLLIGVIASLQSWTRVFAPYAWSWIGDHGGQRVRLIRLSAAGALLSALGLMGVQSAVPVAVVVTLMFLANSAVVPLSESLLAQLLSTARGVDPARYGRVRMWGSIGFITAVTAFGALLQQLGIAIFPAFVAVMNGLLLVAALRLPSGRDEARHDAPAPAVWPTLRQPTVAWFFASVFFTVLAHTSLYAFFSLYCVEQGYGKAAVGGLWAVSVAVEVAAFATQGRWYPWLTAHGWLRVVAWVSVLRFAATAGAGGLAVVLIVAQAAHAVTFAVHHATCINLVQRHFPDRLRGRGQALYTTLGYGLSGVLGGVGGGWLISHAGFAAVFWAAAGCALAATVCVQRAARAEPATTLLVRPA